ncbi:triadin-like isoform X2 [Cyprinodon tularosa]|uniref:Triadin n=1 Tax=Cyprinodon variegatus TaxID=28743 RepID=A0A3Q2DQ30_CYPVA|nr:PREDICTED: triadin isoform X2 [Cyprinodon variegatus]XP_038149233.1 triadin-like isoform X2 [Cyprinodon tularosa]
MSGQDSGGEAGPSSQSNQRTVLDDIILTFTSPMAWLLVVALILTWSGVAIVLFDLLDYKTLADNVRGRRPGLPPPAAIAKRGIKARAALRSLKPSSAGVHGDIAPHESSDWMEMIWSFAASLVAPEEEEEGIHQLTETFTSFSSEEL